MSHRLLWAKWLLAACAPCLLWLACAPVLFAQQTEPLGEPPPPAAGAEFQAALARLKAADEERIATISKVSPAVLAVLSPDGNGGGSGVIISADGYALTNYHVATAVGNYLQCGTSDGRVHDAVLVGFDPVGDVALIKLFGNEPYPFAAMGNSDQVQLGDWCLVMGNPFLLAQDFTPSVSFGLVSGVHRYQYPSGTLLEYADCIQTDAAINPGNSGGPLFNMQGEVIGINGRGSFEKRGRVNVGVGYAISINQIQHFLGHLRGGAIVDHAVLGATFSTDTDGLVIVNQVDEDSDAARRGLRVGDTIVSFAGQEMHSANALKNAIGTFPPGWRLPIVFERPEERIEAVVRLESLHQREELLELVGAGIPNEQPEIPPPAPEGPPGEPGAPGQPDPLKRPALPPPNRPGQGAKEKPVPPQIADLFTVKRGFSNYYFNLLERDAALTRLTLTADFSAAKGPWQFSAQANDGLNLGCLLDDASSKLTLPQSADVVADDTNLPAMLDQGPAGRLLVALHLWRKLLVHGAQGINAIEYEGQFPQPGKDGLHHVLSAFHGGSRARFVLEPGGRLISVEVSRGQFNDPIELLLSGEGELAGQKIPQTWDLKIGDQVELTITIQKAELLTQAAVQ